MFLDGKNPVKLKGSRSYILQDDNLFPWYTVNETMMLACQLKVANTSQQSRQKMVIKFNSSLNCSLITNLGQEVAHVISRF